MFFFVVVVTIRCCCLFSPLVLSCNTTTYYVGVSTSYWHWVIYDITINMLSVFHFKMVIINISILWHPYSSMHCETDLILCYFIVLFIVIAVEGTTNQCLLMQVIGKYKVCNIGVYFPNIITEQNHKDFLFSLYNFRVYEQTLSIKP